MDNEETDRAIEIEFAVIAVFVAGAFIAGLLAAVKVSMGRRWIISFASHSIVIAV